MYTGNENGPNYKISTSYVTKQTLSDIRGYGEGGGGGGGGG